MTPQTEFAQLSKEFDLKPADFYFLNLIPLIEVLWADGTNRPQELHLLYQFLIEHIAFLDKQAGEQVITIDDANDFLERFAHQRPPKYLLKRLHDIILQLNHNSFTEQKQTILDYCMDIAAACTKSYPYPLRGRVIDEEKELLKDLFKAFDIPMDSRLSK